MNDDNDRIKVRAVKPRSARVGGPMGEALERRAKSKAAIEEAKLNLVMAEAEITDYIVNNGLTHLFSINWARVEREFME
jgi:hypothetical protein